MNILLINPPNHGYYYRLGAFYPPLGLAYIASVLKNKGHKVTLVDMNVQKFEFEKADYTEYDVVGISVDTVRYNISTKIAKVVKSQNVPVVFGGHHSAAEFEEILKKDITDYVIVGEGEETFAELLDSLKVGEKHPDIPGLAYLKDGQVYYKPREFIKNLDDIPFPNRDSLPMKLYKTKFDGEPATSLITSRGCPFACEFCSASQFMGRIWRKRSVENVLEEVRLLVDKFGYKSLIFFDDNFTLDPNRVIKLSEGILKKNLKFSWWAFSRADEIVDHEDMVEAMAKAGCKMLFIGFESADDEVLKEYKKNLKTSSSIKAVEILRKYKIDIFASFIIGALKDTKETIIKTVKFAKKLKAGIVQFSILTPYPGTVLYKKLKDKLLTKNYDLFDGTHLVFKHPSFTPKEMRKIFNKAYFYIYTTSAKLLFKRGLPFFIRLMTRKEKFKPDLNYDKKIALSYSHH